MQISVETDARLTDKQLSEFKGLFKLLLIWGASADVQKRLRGNVTIPFDGLGNVGRIRIEPFCDVQGNGVGQQSVSEQTFAAGKS